MEIRKLTSRQEKLEAERVLTTAFLHDIAPQRVGREPQEEKENADEGYWAAFDDTGRMTAAVSTLERRLVFEKEIVPCREMHMVGSLPEARGKGVIRALLGAILRDARESGCLFSLLMPFSTAFYRKFGFELTARNLRQQAEIDQFAGFYCRYNVKQLDSAKDVGTVKNLYEAFSQNYNLSSVRTPLDWEYRGDGEFGQRGWYNAGRRSYTYLFYDESGLAKAYLTFSFVHGPNGPFTGTMEVSDIAFADPEALRNVFGFIYGMRAKITSVRLLLPQTLDLALILPEGGEVRQNTEGQMMLRVLDAERVLAALNYPQDSGEFTIRIIDSFIPEWGGTWRVRFSRGRAVEVSRSEEEPDIEVREETFCQLAVGICDPEAAAYREGTLINGNRETLERVFRKKPVFLKH